MRRLVLLCILLALVVAPATGQADALPDCDQTELIIMLSTLLDSTR